MGPKSLVDHYRIQEILWAEVLSIAREQIERTRMTADFYGVRSILIFFGSPNGSI